MLRSMLLTTCAVFWGKPGSSLLLNDTEFTLYWLSQSVCCVLLLTLLNTVYSKQDPTWTDKNGNKKPPNLLILQSTNVKVNNFYNKWYFVPPSFHRQTVWLACFAREGDNNAKVRCITFLFSASRDSNSRRASLIWMCFGTSGMRKVRMNLKANSPCWNQRITNTSQGLKYLRLSFALHPLYKKGCKLCFKRDQNIVIVLLWDSVLHMLKNQRGQKRERGASGWDRQSLCKWPSSWMRTRNNKFGQRKLWSSISILNTDHEVLVCIILLLLQWE